MHVEITKEFISNVETLIASKNDHELSLLFEEIHHADIAEVLEELEFDDAIYIIKLLDTEKTSEVLAHLDE